MTAGYGGGFLRGEGGRSKESGGELGPFDEVGWNGARPIPGDEASWSKRRERERSR